MEELLGWRIPLGDWVGVGLDWLLLNFQFVWDSIRVALRTAYERLDELLNLPPSWVMIILLAALALYARGWRFAVGSAAALLFIDLLARAATPQQPAAEGRPAWRRPATAAPT